MGRSQVSGLDVAPRPDEGRGQGSGLDVTPGSNVGRSQGSGLYVAPRSDEGRSQESGLDVAPRSDVGRDTAGLPHYDKQGSGPDFTSGSVSEANSYVNNVMVQPICAVMRTPIRGRRKRYLSAPSPGSTVKKLKNKHNAADGDRKTDCSESESEDDCDNDIVILSGSNTRRTVHARRELSRPHTSYVKGVGQNNDSNHLDTAGINTKLDITPDTTLILQAIGNMKNGLETKIDKMDKENNLKFDQIRDEMSNIREGFNQRLEGLAKKVELRVLNAVEKDTKERIKRLEKDIKKDLDKM